MSDADIAQRYAAPTASVALEPPPTQLWRRSVLLMLVLTFLSAGCYPQIWMLRRRHAFNAVESPHKISEWPSIAMLVLGAIEFAAAITRAITDPSTDDPWLIEGAAGYLRIAVGIVFIVQTFFVKSILEDVLTPDGPLGNEAGYHRQLSGLLTFFFSVFYLQYIINRDIVGRRAVADVSQASRGAATAG